MPASEDTLEDVGGERGFGDFGHAVASELAFGGGEVEGGGGFGGVGEDYEAIDGDGEGDEEVNLGGFRRRTRT